MKILRERDMWQIAVLADGVLSAGTKLTCVRISLHHNFKTGQCNPSYAALAAGTAVKIAAIPKQLNQAIERGYLRRISTQGRHSNSYEMTLPTQAAGSGLTADSRIGSTTAAGIGIADANPIFPSDPTTSFGRFEPPTSIHANKESKNNEENREGIDIPPSKSLVLIQQDQDASTTRGFFESFYRAYPRKKSRGDAETALGQVLKKKIATETEIMAGVARLAAYWARRPKSDIQYWPYPASWLRDQGWADEMEDPPPSRNAQDVFHAQIAGFNRRPS